MKKLCQFACLSMVLLSFNASACTPIYLLEFWDTDGSNPGPGGGAPTGTWGVDPDWSTTYDGNVATTAWPAGKAAVFCAAGAYAIGEYTVLVHGTVQVADIHVDQGIVTFQPDPNSGGDLDLIAIDDVDSSCTSRDNRLLSVGHHSADSVATYNVVLKGANGVIRYKRGRLIFGATNTFTGTFTIEGGVVQCAVPYALGATNPLVLANNVTSRIDFDPAWQFTPAVFETGGLNQRLGALNLAGSDASVQRTIDFGSGASALAFADSSGQRWTSDGGLPIPLRIVNYTPGVDSLRFGTSASGLRKAQLGQIRFVDFGGVPGQIDSNGFVTPASFAIQSIRRNGP